MIKNTSKEIEPINNNFWKPKYPSKYFLHVGKTNSGKTYNAIQILKEAGDGIYLAPLRLLAWEIFDKLNENQFICNLITGEEQVESPHAKITSATIEMANFNREYEVAVIDEAFMIGDKDRGKSWLNTILNIKAKQVHIILNDEAFDLISNILKLTERTFEVKKYEMLQKFKFLDTHFVLSKKMPKKGVFVTFSRINVLVNKVKLQNLGYEISVLYGNLPPEIKKRQIADFISGKTDMLVTTDVIGMGINVPCDYLIYLDIEKFDGVTNRLLNPLEIKQISGRTGRYGLSSSEAFVSCLNPKSQKYISHNYNHNAKVKTAYFGFTYEMFCDFKGNTPIVNRIKHFKKANIIPDNLKGIISKEDVSKYLEICELVDIESFDLQTKWALLTAPVKYNNKNYFESLVYKYASSKMLETPYIHSNFIEAKQIEDVISEIELYLNLTRHLNFNLAEKNKITKTKDELIEKLTIILLDKKLSSKKSCKLCPTLISITYPYPYCEDCYNNKVRYY